MNTQLFRGDGTPALYGPKFTARIREFRTTTKSSAVLAFRTACLGSRFPSLLTIDIHSKSVADALSITMGDMIAMTLIVVILQCKQLNPENPPKPVGQTLHNVIQCNGLSVQCNMSADFLLTMQIPLKLLSSDQRGPDIHHSTIRFSEAHRTSS